MRRGEKKIICFSNLMMKKYTHGFKIICISTDKMVGKNKKKRISLRKKKTVPDFFIGRTDKKLCDFEKK